MLMPRIAVSILLGFNKPLTSSAADISIALCCLIQTAAVFFNTTRKMISFRQIILDYLASLGPRQRPHCMKA